MTRKRILLVHQSLLPGGGANAAAAWALEALKDEYDTTLLTWHAVDLPAINRFYGTSLRAGDIAIIRPPSAIRLLRRLAHAPLHRPAGLDAARE